MLTSRKTYYKKIEKLYENSLLNSFTINLPAQKLFNSVFSDNIRSYVFGNTVIKERVY